MGLLHLVLQLVILAVVFGVAIWALKMLFPAAPPILVNGLYVIAVILALLIILRAFGVGDVMLPRVGSEAAPALIVEPEPTSTRTGAFAGHRQGSAALGTLWLVATGPARGDS